MTSVSHAALAAAIPAIAPEWLSQRRWFSSKGRTVASISVADWGALPLDQPGILALALVRYTEGRDELYQLPLIASRDERPEGVSMPPAATIEVDGATWQLHDAFQFAAFQRLLLERLIASEPLPMQDGAIRFAPEQGLRAAPPPLRTIKLVTAEQSNSSIIYDRQAILKGFRRVVAGLNPDVEISHFLTMRAGFEHTPAMLGSSAYVSAAGVEHSLSVLQAFVPNQGDAWEHTLAQLDRFLDAAQRAEAADATTRDTATRRLAVEQLAEIRALGELTGELHRALASDGHDPDFAPQPLTQEQIRSWQATMREEADTILTELERRAPELPPEQRDEVATLLHARPAIAARFAGLSDLAAADVVITRYHGDYHLGQVLVSERGMLILDFEGEPLRSLAERRARSSPLKDVAGMLRSLSYAAQTALRSDADAQPDRAAWIDAWEGAAREAFLAGYESATAGAPFIPQPPALRATTLAAFELEKALYELNYELNNRPDWLPIPLKGIQRTI